MLDAQSTGSHQGSVMPKKYKPRVDVNDPKNARILRLVQELREAVREKHGTGLTYEQRRAAAMELTASMLWTAAQQDLEAGWTQS